MSDDQRLENENASVAASDKRADGEKPGVTIQAAPSAGKKPDKSKPAKTKDQKQDSFKIGTWFKEIKAEFFKIIWPNKKDLAKMTVTVIVTSLIFGFLIAGLDSVFGFAVGVLVNMF